MVLLIGWQFDPRTQLDPLNPPYGAAGEVGHQMRRLAWTKPNLKIRLLVWNSPLPIVASQGMFPQRAVQWFNTNPVDLRLVKPLSAGAAHHQKILVIDDRLAFCSGAIFRWTAGTPASTLMRRRTGKCASRMVLFKSWWVC